MKAVIAILFLGSLSWFHRLSAGEIKFELLPNPSSGQSQIHINTISSKPVIVEIFSILGNKIATYTMPSGQSTFNINLDNQPSGMYLVRLSDGNNCSVKRLKVQHF